MIVEMDGWKRLVIVRGNSITGITTYKPSNWLYLLTGLLPEKLHLLADRLRWKLEDLNI